MRVLVCYTYKKYFRRLINVADYSSPFSVIEGIFIKPDRCYMIIEKNCTIHTSAKAGAAEMNCLPIANSLFVKIKKLKNKEAYIF